MFQGYEQTLQIPFPKGGINVADSNNSENARYLQNILLGNNNVGRVRYGTYLKYAFAFNPNRIFRSILHGNSFLKTDGTSENIVYVNYLSELPFIDMETDVQLSSVEDNSNITRFCEQKLKSISTKLKLRQNSRIPKIHWLSYQTLKIYA